MKPAVTFLTSRSRFRGIAIVTGVLLFGTALSVKSEPASDSTADIAQQIGAIMSQKPSGRAGLRFVHAKGIVCQGSFQPAPGASAISRAAHFGGDSVPVTVRFSDGAPDLAVPDNSPDAGPQGMAIRFMVGRGTDIVANSHNGFVVGTPEDFLALQRALSSTDPSGPHPWPIEKFLQDRPLAIKFVQDVRAVPASFANQAFFGNHAFIFVNNEGQKQAGRYQIVPEAGLHYLDDATAKAMSPNFLIGDIQSRLAHGPVRYRLLLQLAGPGDVTNDASLVWPESRKVVELGVLSITSTATDNAAAENELAFDPTRLIDGIQLSDDPLPRLRSRVYAISVASRRAHQKAH
jgi:catalase